MLTLLTESGTGWRGGEGEAKQVLCHMPLGIFIRCSHDSRRGQENVFSSLLFFIPDRHGPA